MKVIREVKPDKIAAGYETLVSPDGAMLVRAGPRARTAPPAQQFNHHAPPHAPQVAVNTIQDDALRGLGAAREVVNRVQKLRKRLRLQVRAGGRWARVGRAGRAAQ